MSKLQELVKKRGSYKGRLTKFENYLDNLNNVSDCSQLDKLELKLRMNKIESLYTEFDEVQTNIECLSLPEEEHQNQCLQRSEFESQYFSVMARAHEFSGAFKKTKKSFNYGDNGSVSSDSSVSDHESVVNTKQIKSCIKGVKLPTIHIPKYSGEYGSWLEFRDTFLSLIHDNSSISNIQKFHYLRASLEGSAAQIIRSLEFSASNYCLAWNALCERYDNTRLLVQNHIKAIFDHESLKKESAVSLRTLIDMYTKNIRALQILGEPTGSWDTLIIFIICLKLDSRTLRDWEEHKSTHKTINLEIFTKFLKNKADLLETIENNNSKPETSHRCTIKNFKSLASVTDTASRIFKCILCQGEHGLYKCDSFLRMNVPEREKYVKQNKLCRNCLRGGGHTERSCRLGPCRLCTLKHNSLLHIESSPDTPAPAPAAAVSLSASTCQPGQVLLATAIVKILDINNTFYEVKAILDSVITSSLRKSLNANLYNIPTGIKLADPEFYNPSSIDLLLGADIFWDLLCTNKIYLGKNSPVLQDTKFGYIIS
ncbi:jg6931, partial [Pararge aegeria aegeria]